MDKINAKQKLIFTATMKEHQIASLKKLFKDGVNQETGEVIPGIRIEEVETISLK